MSISIYDLSKCPYSNRHGMYGGAAGDKDGIVIDGNYWIVKYPKPEREFEAPINMSYNTSPLSEYIGSHIYEVLGIPVHETILGIRNNKIVVACKDFCETRGQLTEMKTIKNGANHELESILDQEMHYSSTGERVNLNELLLHLDHNPILQSCQGVKERFWRTVVIDLFIDNKDRNNGNWGLLFHEKDNKYTLAPVYDNENSFANKTNDEKIQKILSSNEIDKKEYYNGSRTVYDYNGHKMSAKKMIQFDHPDLRKAIIELTPIIYARMDDIHQIINNIPEQSNGKIICSKERKEFYNESLDSRLEHLILPEFAHINDISIKQAKDILEDCKQNMKETMGFMEDYDEWDGFDPADED